MVYLYIDVGYGVREIYSLSMCESVIFRDELELKNIEDVNH